MILRNVNVYGTEGVKQIHIANGRINMIAEEGNELNIPGEKNLDLEGAIILPGLINSHEHLDFNLFPQLGKRIYNNYTEWGPDIQAVNKDIISQVRKVPPALQVKWSLYKNLLNGFTTVVNHGERLAVEDDLVHVFQDCRSLHSPSFEKNWKWKLNNPFSVGKMVVMHIGEGTDREAAMEIDEVLRWNILKKKIIAVHGVAMNEKQATSFEGLVWCPASNYFLLGQTAAVEKLMDKTTIVFGTDSTLTASWNSWEHFRKAISPGLAREDQLLNMLTTAPAQLWPFAGRGIIAEGAIADLLVINKTTALFSTNPADILLIMTKGIPRLADEILADKIEIEDYSHIHMNDRIKKVQGNLPALVDSIRKYFPNATFPFTHAW